MQSSATANLTEKPTTCAESVKSFPNSFESNHLRIHKCHQKYQFHPRSCVIMCIWSHYRHRDSGGIRSCEWRWRWRPRILHGPNLSCALFRIVREEKVQAQEDVEPAKKNGTCSYQPVTRIPDCPQRLSSAGTNTHEQRSKLVTFFRLDHCRWHFVIACRLHISLPKMRCCCKHITSIYH